MTKDLETCAVFYSVLGDDKQKRRAAMMPRAGNAVESSARWRRGSHTRIAPRLHFEYDESIEESSKMTQLLDRLTKERESREVANPNESADPNEDAPPARANPKIPRPIPRHQRNHE